MSFVTIVHMYSYPAIFSLFPLPLLSSFSSLLLFSCCLHQPQDAVSSLVHFSTYGNLAQVVVVGTQEGTVSWYIAQPPQKTYSLLSFDRPHYPHSVVALQVCVCVCVHVHVCAYVPTIHTVW